MDNEFVSIPNFSNYEINRNGIVRRVKNKRILSQRLNRGGYCTVHLYQDKKYKDCLVHRLVAIIFLPNPLNKPCVNHIDANRTNSSLENLEWCTHQENTAHAYRIGRKNQNGEKNTKAKLTEQKVKEIRYLFKTGTRQKEISILFNVAQNTISEICNRKLWRHI